MTPNLTIDDLITALAERLEYAKAHEDLKTYFDQRAALVCEAFGCDIEKRCAEMDRQARENRRKASQLRKAGEAQVSRKIQREIDAWQFQRLLNECLQLIHKSMMPGAICVEGQPPRLEQELSEKYRDLILGRERELKDLYRGMVRDLLEYLLPGIGKWSIPAEKLFEMGLPREKPDVNEYF